MTLYITAWAAVLLGALYSALTFTIIYERRTKRIVHGDNGDKAVMKKIRGHANAAEQIPLFLILSAFNEHLNGPLMAGVLAVIFIAGRIAHAAYFNFGAAHFHYRQFGMLGTLVGQNISIVAIAIGLLFN